MILSDQSRYRKNVKIGKKTTNMFLILKLGEICLENQTLKKYKFF